MFNNTYTHKRHKKTKDKLIYIGGNPIFLFKCPLKQRELSLKVHPLFRRTFSKYIPYLVLISLKSYTLDTRTVVLLVSIHTTQTIPGH